MITMDTNGKLWDIYFGAEYLIDEQKYQNKSMSLWQLIAVQHKTHTNIETETHENMMFIFCWGESGVFRCTFGETDP